MKLNTMPGKNYYAEFEKERDKYVQTIKEEYLFAIDIAPEKVYAHNNFQNTRMHVEDQRLIKELGQHTRFLLDIRDAMKLDRRIAEPSEFNKRFSKVESDDKGAFCQSVYLVMFVFVR